MWLDESELTKTLAVYDADTGTELVSIVDDRLEIDLFWTADDRIITAEDFGELREWNPATLDAVSEGSLAEGDTGCSGGNGAVFDPRSGALFLKSDGLCRVDTATGAEIQYESDDPTTLLAVAIGGNEIYLRATDAAGDLILRTLDATTLDVISEEPFTAPNPVIAASTNGVIEQEDRGFGNLVQPSGRRVDFYTSGITTSAGGGYYLASIDGGNIVISSSEGSTIGTIDNSDSGAVKAAWSADDTVLATRSEAGVSVYRLG